MAEQTYGFSAEGVKRIVEAVRDTESRLQNPTGTLRSKGGIVQGSPIRRFRLIEPLSPGGCTSAYMLGKDGALLESHGVCDDGTMPFVVAAGSNVKGYWDEPEAKYFIFDAPCPSASGSGENSGDDGNDGVECGDIMIPWIWRENEFGEGGEWEEVASSLECPPGCTSSPPSEPGTEDGQVEYVPCGEGDDDGGSCLDTNCEWQWDGTQWVLLGLDECPGDCHCVPPPGIGLFEGETKGMPCGGPDDPGGGL